MKIGVVLSFIKTLIAVNFLQVDQFSQYAVFLSISYFLSYLLSFGSVEGSVKSFPRFVELNKFVFVKINILKITLKLFRNAFFLFFSLVLVSGFISFSFIDIVLIVLLALTGSLSSLFASYLRALGRLSEMALSNTIRAFFILALIFLFSQLENNYHSMIIAEVLGSLFGIYLYFRFSSLSLCGFNINISKFLKLIGNKKMHSGLGSGGKFVAFAYFVNSIPFYLDKWLSTHFLVSSEVGVFVFSSTLLAVALVIMNLISQYIGANLIVLTSSSPFLQIAIYVVKWAAVGVSTWFAFLATYYTLYYYGLLPDGLLKYNLGFKVILILALLGASFVTQIFEFILIGYDRERLFFLSAAGHIALLVMLLLISYNKELNAVGLISYLVIARSGYFILLVLSLFVSRKDFINA